MKLLSPLKPHTRVHLNDIPSDATGGLSREEAEERMSALNLELKGLQELLYGASSHSVLLILQGRDTSGKDGTIKSVFDNVDPQGCQITGFKVPTPEERAHDFLWRVHHACPARGRIGIFNRSHYEDVLVPRVMGQLSKESLRQRFHQINAFEQMLSENGTLILKCYLHISPEEQEERLLERERNPLKSWKLAVSDWKDRQHWDTFTEAYEDLMQHCAADHAPWYVVPADRKWYRNLAITELLVRTLSPLREVWQAQLEAQGRAAIADIAAYRAQLAHERSRS